MSAIKMLFASIIFLSFFSSCNDKDPLSPEYTVHGEDGIFKLEENNGYVSVMTRNIYVGTDVDVILQAEDQTQIPVLVTQAFQTLANTNFPERAEALAKEIKKNKPHLIGLQEVSLIRLQSPGDYMEGGTTLAENVVWDYLEILLTTLKSMGLDYEVVAQNQNFDLEMPMLTKFEEPYDEFDDVRLTDFDVVLAKKGISISNVESKNYQVKAILEDLGIEFSRGFNAVTAEINGCKFRFVNTHLEDETILEVQKAQAFELRNYLENVDIPVILVGDFNSAPIDESSYQIITSGHDFKDTWLLNTRNDNPDGFTFGHDADLRNTEQKFSKRIDHIFVRNEKEGSKFRLLKHVTSNVTGDEYSDRTFTGLWPSDHGGVAAKLKFMFCKKNRCKLER
jgi:endonuclease/exonuclease/phosphatase family metal-dependent hydrolase